MNDAVSRHFSSELTDYQNVIDVTLGAIECHEVLPQGWKELGRLPKKSRIELTEAYWNQILGVKSPFFELISDVRPFLVKENDKWRALLVYSFLEEPLFLFGEPPANEIEIAKLGEVADFTLPLDYRSFLKIHNGFGKNGYLEVLKVTQLRSAHQVLDVALKKRDPAILYRGEEIDPYDIVPFYKAHHRADYQCFFRRWLHDGEMGNVVCSLSEGYVADHKANEESLESLAFPTFLKWLNYYVMEE